MEIKKVKKVLITGASGYLAKFIIERLLAEHELTLFDRVEPRFDIKDMRFLLGDITCYSDVEKACEGQDAVVHLVALVRERYDKPASMFADVMVKGTWNVAEACVKQKVKRLVNISSIIACGKPLSLDRAYRVGDPHRFVSGDLYYCLAKHLGEQVAYAYHQAHGLSVIQIRPGVIAGDGRNPGPQAPKAKEPNQPWFMYVDPRDVAQAVEKALQTQSVNYGCFNIVAGRKDSSFDWTQAAQELGYSPEYNWPEIPDTR